MKINNYSVSSANATDKILATDATTGVTKNITPEGIMSYMDSTYYNCLLNQASTAAPVVTIAGENTVGTIVWTYSAVGTYLGTLTGAFLGSAFFNLSTPSNVLHTFSITKTSDDVITLNTYLSGSLSDDVLINQGLQIKVY